MTRTIRAADLRLAVAPGAALAAEVTVYSSGSPIVPALVAHGLADELAWTVVEWAGERPNPGSLRAADVLDAAERFAALCDKINVPANWGWAVERAERAVWQATEMLGGVSTSERAVLVGMRERALQVPTETELVTVHGDLNDGNFCVAPDGRSLRLLDGKCVAGTLCSEAGFVALMLEDHLGERGGRSTEVLDALVGRSWADPEHVRQWLRWFAVERAISWQFNRNQGAVVLARTARLALD